MRLHETPSEIPKYRKEDVFELMRAEEVPWDSFREAVAYGR